MLKKFKKHLDQKLSFLKEGKLLIAISGGVDSIVLAHLCHKLDLNFALAHCNFNLRGDESDADQDFVFEWAESLGVEVFIEHFNTTQYAEDFKVSTQMAARELRYNWFEDLMNQLQFDIVLTGHHADDNLETFLINFIRGTGLDGLTGIPEVNAHIVRPLLPFSRVDIKTYAKQHNLSWREDSSNASTKYLRNKLRHDLVPILKDINPQLLQSFNHTIECLKDSKAIVDDRIDAVSDSIIDDVSDFEIRLNISEIKKLNHPKAYLFELLKDYGFTEWNDVIHLLDAQSGKQVFSETHRLIKDREYILLSDINPNLDPGVITVSDCDDKIKTPVGTLFFEKVTQIGDCGPNIIYVDCKKLKFPLTLRHWEEGDYFHPLGMKGKKKVSKYFKDEKMSLLDKEQTLLLCSGDYVIWVVGKRADARFKISDKTKNFTKIELK